MWAAQHCSMQFSSGQNRLCVFCCVQYAVFVGINGWHGNNIFYIFSVSFSKSSLLLPCLFSDSVFLICKIINVAVRVISTLIISHIPKPHPIIVYYLAFLALTHSCLVHPDIMLIYFFAETYIWCFPYAAC